MKLQRPFYQFPIRFDQQRLQEEVAQFSESEWRAHPSSYAGNSALPLISASGESNDEMEGTMLPTPALERCPYIRQVLASFDTVWGRARLMRLGPGHKVPPHSDLHYYWFHRVRLHVPIITDPDIQFHCADSSVHMAAGEAWTFDNWRTHQVINPSDVTRIHLTADTSGTHAFWRLLDRGATPPSNMLKTDPEILPFRPDEDPPLRTERFNIGPVLHPSEVERLRDHLLTDIDREATPTETVEKLTVLLDRLCRNWRCLWYEYGDQREGFKHFEALRAAIGLEADKLSEPSPLLTGGVTALSAVQGLVLKSLINLDLAAAPKPEVETPKKSPQVIVVRQKVLEKPVFIVSAPRSGSTLLFETLAKARDLWTIGGESHQVFEALPQLRPGAPGVDSNRLGANLADRKTARTLRWTFAKMLKNRAGEPFDGTVQDSARMLEKTPKNALRIPFLDAVFSNGLFIWLYREPEDNISSIMEAWKSGRFVTYKSLPDWDSEWSLSLPPGWQALKESSLAERAAFQWSSANRYIMNDLGKLPQHRWTSLRYETFLENPAREIERLCQFASIEFDPELQEFVSGELPLSRYTLTAPGKEKWRANEADILQVLPATEDLQRQFTAALEARARS